MQDKTLRTAEVTSLRKQIEQEYLAKVKLEDDILERMRAQLTMDKASQYSKKLTKKTRDLTKHLVCSILFFNCYTVEIYYIKLPCHTVSLFKLEFTFFVLR